jgi:hypothetical protein
MNTKCYKCSTTLELTSGIDVARNEECPKCFSDVRCCFMCHFYDKNSYNECREPTADRITDKEKANFCDHFKLKSSSQNPIDFKNNVLNAANALFKK